MHGWEEKLGFSQSRDDYKLVVSIYLNLASIINTVYIPISYADHQQQQGQEHEWEMTTEAVRLDGKLPCYGRSLTESGEFLILA